MHGRVLRGLAVVAVLGLGAVGWLVWHTTGMGADAAGGATPFRFKYDWPAGTELTYALSWSAEEKTRLPVPGEEGELARGVLGIDGELVLRSYGRSGDGYLLSARLRELRRHELDFWGQKLLADEESARATLESHEARLRLSSTGKLEEVSFAADAPELFEHLMLSLLTDAQVPVPTDVPEGEWEAEEPTHFGRAHVHYRADGPDALTRERRSYASLHVLSGGSGPHQGSSAGVVRFAPEGHLLSLREEESLQVSGADGKAVLEAQTSVRLELRRRGRFDPASAPLAKVEKSRRPGEIAFSADTERRLLEQRVDGMTGEQLVSDLEQMGNGGMMPDHNRWLWRATGLLQLHPELATKLGERFGAPGTNAQGKALILDLLASASTKESQSVMREALASPAARNEKDFPLFLQRFSVVPRPEPESAEFLAHTWQDAAVRKHQNVERASAMALGSVIHGLQESGDPGAAGEHLAQLTRALDAAKAEGDRAVLVRALGNAGAADSAPVLLAAANDPSLDVRAAAASALRKRPEPEATQALLGLTQDTTPLVGQTALVSLDSRSLSDDELATLIGAVTQGKMPRTNDAQLATLLHGYLQRSPEVARALEYLVARNAEDPDLQARLNAILRDAPAGG